jgi:hypothetical protein
MGQAEGLPMLRAVVSATVTRTGKLRLASGTTYPAYRGQRLVFLILFITCGHVEAWPSKNSKLCFYGYYRQSKHGSRPKMNLIKKSVDFFKKPAIIQKLFCGGCSSGG